METETIRIEFDDNVIENCVSAILVPEKALEEPGYITTLTAGKDAHSKHEYHAMAQMAYYQYQDHEIDIQYAISPVQVVKGVDVEIVGSGMVIYRDGKGEIHILIHSMLNKKKMLERTHRYCTRWVRLDI